MLIATIIKVGKNGSLRKGSKELLDQPRSRN